MKKGDHCASATSHGTGGLSDGLRAGHSIVSVVSGFSSSKVSACRLIIKEFCGGKAGWNDGAIFIETEKSNAKMLYPLSYQTSYEPSFLGKSTSAPHSFSSYAGVLRVPLPVHTHFF